MENRRKFIIIVVSLLVCAIAISAIIVGIRLKNQKNDQKISSDSEIELNNNLEDEKDLEVTPNNNDQTSPPSPTPSPIQPILSETTPISTEPAMAIHKGNLPNNIVNRGNFATQSNLLYYSNISDNYSLYVSQLDGGPEKKLNNEFSIYINVIDDWIYYYNGYEGYNICKIRLDGSDRQVILEDTDCSYMTVIGDWIYYCEYSYTDDMETDYGKMYKISINGTEQIKLCDDAASVMIVDEYADWVYYSSDDDAIYRILTDGSNKTKLSESGYLRAVEEDNYGRGYVYYYYHDNDSDFHGLFKMANDGTEKTLITDDYIYFMNASDEWIYYANASDGGFYKIKSDGSEKTKLTDNFCFNIHIIEDWIYYFFDNEGLVEVYKIRTNGSENQLFMQE